MARQTEAGEMTEADFNTAVSAELKDRGREAVAEMSELFDGDMASMSAATVAREENLALTEKAVGEVANLREWWHDEHYVEYETVE